MSNRLTPRVRLFVSCLLKHVLPRRTIQTERHPDHSPTRSLKPLR